MISKDQLKLIGFKFFSPYKANGRPFTFYQRIESLVALILTIIITFVIFVSLFRLSNDVIRWLLLDVLNPLEHKTFQSVFGQIMTVLIALEFNHTILYVVSREQSIIQIKTILLISILALARKFIILDLAEISAEQLIGLAAITLVLGSVYWLVCDREDRQILKIETLVKGYD